VSSAGVLTDLAGFLSAVAWATEDGDGRAVGGAETDLDFAIWLPDQSCMGKRLRVKLAVWVLHRGQTPK
jgi:hypothetical protein